eukprot:Hpha_TRINITY_DN16830_c4_g6::TRINITY_DN16830_c4_g6_i1::g.153708::m.153708
MNGPAEAAAGTPPVWLTHERLAVTALLAEIASQKDKNNPAAKARAEAAQRRLTQGGPAEGGGLGEEERSLMTNIEPLTRVVRSEEVLCRFLHKYVIARTGRLESAAERVLNLCEVLKGYPHLRITFDDDIATGYSLGVINFFPVHRFPIGDRSFSEEAAGCVGQFVRIRYLDWGKVSLEQMQKTFFFHMFQATMCPVDDEPHPLQRYGLFMHGSGVGAGPSNIKIKFHIFILKLISQCMPIRLRGALIFNAPFVLRNVAWPVMRQFLSAKMAERIRFVDKPEEVRRVLGIENTHVELGGRWQPMTSPDAESLDLIRKWTDPLA